MKLSMRMIANQLTNLDLELNISNNDSLILKSARRVYATNCVHIFKSGSDVICNGEGNYIRIKDIGISQAFEIVQSIFDFYNDWTDNVIDNCKNLDFQCLINNCWKVFKNPILLLDSNYKLISMSDKYGENDVNNEWYHLKKYNYSSPKVMQFLKKNELYNYKFFELSSKFYRFEFNDIKNSCISAPIYFNHIYCGRISVIQKDRDLNKGDIQLLDYLLPIIAPHIKYFYSENIMESRVNIFLSLIDNKKIDYDNLNKQLEYRQWNEEDTYRLFILKPKLDSITKDLLILYCAEIENNICDSCVFIKDKNIIIIHNEKNNNHSKTLKIFKKICSKYMMNLGISLPFTSFSKLNLFYEQALYALSFQITSEANKFNHSFYDYAMDYIIETHITSETIYFCHPDILKLWILDKSSNKDRINTLYLYLINERSITNTSQYLYLHRNTLIYRIKKINEMLDYDINDSYTRNYMVLSIKLLQCHKRKFNNENI